MSNGAANSAIIPDEAESEAYGSNPRSARGDGNFTHTGGGGGDGQFDFSFSTSLVRDSLAEKHKHTIHSINTPHNSEHAARDRKLSFCKELTGKMGTKAEHPPSPFPFCVTHAYLVLACIIGEINN
jgi:hypothetical protein